MACGTYQCLYHIWLVVAEGLCSIENVYHVMTLDHLQDHGRGTESAAPTTPIPSKRNTQTQSTEKWCITMHLKPFIPKALAAALLKLSKATAMLGLSQVLPYFWTNIHH